MAATQSASRGGGNSSNEDSESDASSTRRKAPTTQMCPLDLRFSQKKMRNVFADQRLIEESVGLVQAVRRSPEDAELYDALWCLETPFPPIEVIRWRCKLRDDITGRPQIDPKTGSEVFDSEESWFTLDNRRLYCLQRAALQLLPDRCTAHVIAEVRKDRRLREIRKFRTLDSGKSILVGSRVDGVPFTRWSWRDVFAAPSKGVGCQSVSLCASAKGKADRGSSSCSKGKGSSFGHSNWSKSGEAEVEKGAEKGAGKKGVGRGVKGSNGGGHDHLDARHGHHQAVDAFAEGKAKASRGKGKGRGGKTFRDTGYPQGGDTEFGCGGWKANSQSGYAFGKGRWQPMDQKADAGCFGGKSRGRGGRRRKTDGAASPVDS
eukprot:TRINITY_DN74849_c0_g1_i1.p1 TRINITY_DN74849_c0_g1~~TRINITY_DN74849_c0_g1_i1.p1  ORF type:complete len:395 (-),score=63.00 TRINITY_DN74849_c0_g1_i1:68-1195(-)